VAVAEEEVEEEVVDEEQEAEEEAEEEEVGADHLEVEVRLGEDVEEDVDSRLEAEEGAEGASKRVYWSLRFVYLLRCNPTTSCMDMIIL
jgi:hypothetical protein